jgi:hypothetical protein
VWLVNLFRQRSFAFRWFSSRYSLLNTIYLSHMTSWAAKKQFTYLSLFIGVLLVLVGIPLFAFFYEAPTCFDGKHNGRETGIDCGGSCKQLCSADFLSPIVSWRLAHRVTSSTYNLVAYVENPNVEATASNVVYRFKVYDRNGILITHVEGVTDLMPQKVTPIFEGGVQVGTRVPATITFEFLTDPFWRKGVNDNEIFVTESRVSRTDSRPRLDAMVENRSLYAEHAISFIAIVYDENNNAFASSKTVLSTLNPKSKLPIVFTWPEAFARSVSRIEIIPIFK